MQQELYPLSFSEPEKEDWLQAVTKELKGRPFNEHLVWSSIDGFEIPAYHDGTAEEVAVPVPQREWKIIAPIMADEALKANELALEALNNGAEAVWFHKPFQGAAAEVATKGINTDIAPVMIRHQSLHDPFRSLFKNGTFETQFSGTIWINGRRLRDRGASMIQEVALMLAMGQHAVFEGATSLVFSTGLGSETLSESAKLRAFHTLWNGWLNACNRTDVTYEVIAENLRSIQCVNDEYNNVIRATSAAVAASYGGCDFLLLRTWQDAKHEQYSLSSRTMRMVGVLLKEESHLTKCLNPVDGAYFLESLTTTLAKKSWELAQQLSKDGLVESIVDGTVKQMLKEHGASMLDSLKSNESTLCGVNQFKPDKQQAATQRTSEHNEFLPPFLDLEFELLNDQSSEA